jgi:hypothetical protein
VISTNKPFSFVAFFKKYCCQNITTVKDKMQFEDIKNENDILKSARNMIFENLSLNKAF